MRTIKYIAVHCTATAQTATIDKIQTYWREHLGWQSPGYHFIVKPNGEAVNLLSVDKVSNGVKGFNHETINISYIGGVDAKGNPFDNRTKEQKTTLLKLLKDLKKQFPNAIIQGHRDFPNVKKACPSFNAKNEYKNV
ncbi:N-acetylmuramoyl-L-alanine amidase [Flavobacterium covae]|uniref:N-acetylmuramoyl-L-alanine amidase n=1 Tax=Flavobacterium covae TaxID=2906076 RepID=A0ABW8PJ27_9FLAO|nr:MULTISPECIES: N-acetylmuramoyl-L-alanine amidase [Flavobacterium]OWP80712.1 N-acetylmuramoyl-L-alanine amidase [Flavobacterium covae]POR21311.1 N-acetylmuramoyl-L-alanine amidase [Flavobacterium columnare]